MLPGRAAWPSPWRPSCRRSSRRRASCCCWSLPSRGRLLALRVPRRRAHGEGAARARLHLARTRRRHAVRGAGPRAPRSPWSTSSRRGPPSALSWPAPWSQVRYRRALAAQRRTCNSSSSSRPGFAAQRRPCGNPAKTAAGVTDSLRRAHTPRQMTTGWSPLRRRTHVPSCAKGRPASCRGSC